MQALVLLLALALAAPVRADQVAADCALLTDGLRGVGGYTLSVPPARADAGWCVLDGLALRNAASGLPDLTAQRLRLRGTLDGAGNGTVRALVGLEVDLMGLRVAFAPGDASIDDRLRGIVRLQTADLRLVLRVDAESGLVRLSDGLLRLSGGTTLGFRATLRAGGLSASALGFAALTEARLDWRSDGRLARPLMEMAGEKLLVGATATAAVDATRLFLRQIADNLPEAALAKAERNELDQALDALPQGRGRLTLALTVPAGIGAADLLLAGLGDDPLGPQALAQLLQGAVITALWTPGIAP